MGTARRDGGWRRLMVPIGMKEEWARCAVCLCVSCLNTAATLRKLGKGTLLNMTDVNKPGATEDSDQEEGTAGSYFRVRISASP